MDDDLQCDECGEFRTDIIYAACPFWLRRDDDTPCQCCMDCRQKCEEDD